MKALMLAAQEETRVSRHIAARSHELTEAMKKDSLSMKTVNNPQPLGITGDILIIQ